MSSPLFPEASWLGNGLSGGSFVGNPPRIVVHTTETEGVPRYRGGRSAPHVTYYPRLRRFYQHTSHEVAARALVNAPGGGQTNRANAHQLEVVCYSASHIANQAPHRRLRADRLTEEHLGDIARWVAWVCTEFGVQPLWRPKPYSDSRCSGTRSACRMTLAAWGGFNAICDHAQVPDGNKHWDADGMNVARIAELARGIIGQPGEDEGVLRRGQANQREVVLLQVDLQTWADLWAPAFPGVPDHGEWDDATARAVLYFQQFYPTTTAPNGDQFTASDARWLATQIAARSGQGGTYDAEARRAAAAAQAQAGAAHNTALAADNAAAIARQLANKAHQRLDGTDLHVPSS